MIFWKKSKQIFKEERIKDILKTNYIIPKTIQRDVEQGRIDELSRDFENDFLPFTPIYFCILNKQRYLVDGQHRLEIFKNKCEYSKIYIWVSEIEVETEQELKSVFKIINNQLALNDLWKQPETVKEILLETIKFFETNYPNGFKYNGKRRPYINKEVFKTQITNIQNELNFSSSNELINRILYINHEYSQQEPDYFPKRNKSSNRDIIYKLQKENCLYLSLVEEWVRHCLENKIPSKLQDNFNREKVWLTFMGNKAKGNCYCCEEKEITPFHFEAGHVIPKAFGGSDDVENLRPICSPCNKGMGTENLYDYKHRMFSKSKI